MSDNKKYYYLKLKDTHFDDERIVVLESLPDGILYSNIYLKLCLKSVKREGKLMFNDRIPYNSQILAQVTRHPVGVVEKAIQILQEFDLIEVLDNGAIYINDIQNYIGTSSTEADRKREYRNRIESEKENLLEDGQMSGQMSDECPDKSPPEKEIKKEKELEKEKEIKKDCVNDFFESIWNLYPEKRKGKSTISDTNKKELYKIGFDEMKRAIERYSKEVYAERDNGFKAKNFKDGSTFFRTNYKDYLDANYEEQEIVKVKKENKDDDFFKELGGTMYEQAGNGEINHGNQGLLSMELDGYE